MLNYVLRDVDEMYKFVLEARILANTNISLLVQKCPRLTSLVIYRGFEIAEDPDFPIDEELLENNGIEYSDDPRDMEDIKLLSSLLVTKLKYCERVDCIYPLARFPHLKFLEANHITLLEPTKIEEVICINLTTEPRYSSTLKRVTANYRHQLYKYVSDASGSKSVLNTKEPEFLPYVSLDFGFSAWTKGKGTVNTIVQANKILRGLSRLPIKHLTLNGDNLGSSDLSILSSLFLTSLKVSHMEPPESFRDMPIETLEIAEYNSSKTNLSMFKNLKKLVLYRGTIDIDTIADLKIHTLDLHNVACSNISSIARLPLKKLILSSMDIIPIADLSMDLDELHLRDIRSDSPIQLTLLPNLKTLVIKTPSPNIKFDFTVLRQVTKFVMVDYKISMDETVHLSTLPITNLTLKRCGVTDEMLLVLKSLNLQYCDLSENKISGLGLSNFRHMKLRELKCPPVSICQILK